MDPDSYRDKNNKYLHMKELLEIYTHLGATFATPIDECAKKLQQIKAFVFDWDGVFNNGVKGAQGGSDFSEVDSMGANLLRYSFYLKHKTNLPLTAVLSGEKNETAFYFCEREGFNYSFYKTGNKLEALKLLCEVEKIQPNEIAYFFDDVLDLSFAENCGLRFLINQKANPLFINYCKQHRLVDYISANSGGQHAIREISELLISLNGNYSEVITSRKNNTESYKIYLTKRKLIKPEFYTLKEDRLERTEK